MGKDWIQQLRYRHGLPSSVRNPTYRSQKRLALATGRHKVIAVAFVGTIQALHEAFFHFKSVDICEREMGLFASVTETSAFIAKVTGIDTAY